MKECFAFGTDNDLVIISPGNKRPADSFKTAEEFIMRMEKTVDVCELHHV
jgi:anthranilate/para-aminobenzoate synthase component II